MASNFGGMIQSVGASWMMTSISGNAEMVALVQSSVTLPIMLLALLAGAAADGFDRRAMMLGAQGFMLLVSLALAATAWLGLITPWLLLCFTFLIGCGAAFHGPAWQTSVGEMVPRADLPGAVTLNSMGFNIARSVGPALGGAIVAALGAATAFAINAVSYLGLLAVLLRWRPAQPEQSLPREPLGRAMAGGLRFAAWSPPIRAVLFRALVFGAGASAVSALMPIIARDLVGGGPATYGLLLGAFGLGAVGGAIGSARLRGALTPEWIVRTACLLFAVAAALLGLSEVLPITLALLLLCGASWVLALSTFNVIVQLSAPRWVVGRSLSLYQMAAFGGMAGGAWLWGFLAERQSVTVALLVAAGVMAVCAAIGLRLPVADLSQLEVDGTTRSWTPPAIALPIEPREGAVVITIDWKIRAEDEAEFLAIMAEERRARIRDGARRWTLLRDLSDPSLWIERYHVATWVDYVRHNQRRTHADDENSFAIRQLQLDGYEPVVRRRIERQTGSLPSTRTPDARELDAVTDATRSS